MPVITWLRSSLLFFTLAMSAPGLAQDGTWEKAFLWQVQKGEQKLYLLGSLSVGKRAFYPLPKSVGEAVRDADVVMLEADSTDAEASQRALQIGMYERGDSLDKHLPPELYEELLTLALNYDIPEGQLRGMRPWMLYFQIIFKEFANAGYLSDYSIETVVYALAKGLNKEVGAMETADASAKFLNTVAPQLQESMLRGLLAELKEGGAVKSLEALWRTARSGDEPGFVAAMEANEKLYPNGAQLREALFYARHPAMLEKIEGYLASGKKHLVVLGAVNMFGERGLVAALRNKGYEVKPL